MMKVAQLSSADLRPYRVAFYERLASFPDLELTLYLPAPRPGSGAPATRVTSPVPYREVGNVYWPGGAHRAAWQRGSQAILSSDAGVIVCPEIVHNLSVWAIRFRHRGAGKRLVLTGFFYRRDGSSLRSKVHAWLLRVLRSSASAYLPYTERGKSELMARGVAEERISVVGNTMDTTRLRSLHEAVTLDQRESFKALHGLTGSVVVYLGRLLREKHAEVAVEAMKQLEGVSLVVVGDGPEAERLKRSAPENVVFLGAIYDEEMLAPILAAADVMWLPGRVGLTAVHAFSAGLPVVTTSASLVFQSPEFDYLENEINSVVLQSLSPEQHAEAVQSLLGDTVRLERLREGAGRTAARMSLDAMADAFVAGVRTALSSPPRA